MLHRMGTYLLRTPEHEHEIDRIAHHWWQTGSLPKVPPQSAENDHEYNDPLPDLPDGASELVFHGARVWPYENEMISFEGRLATPIGSWPNCTACCRPC